jgi:DNA-binding transcriptional MocR family regulator
MAVELQVNANTVARVYAELERSGVIETKRGVGSFISASPSRAHPPRDHERRVRAFVTRVLADADAHGLSVDDVMRGFAHTQKEERNGSHCSQSAAVHVGLAGSNVNVVAIASPPRMLSRSVPAAP